MRTLNRDGFYGHSRAVSNLAVVLERRHVTTEAVPTRRTVEHFDIVNDILHCLVTGAMRISSISFPLEQQDGALGNAVVMGFPRRLMLCRMLCAAMRSRQW
jgi:hypothetical protein